jgi:hypothetical protein
VVFLLNMKLSYSDIRNTYLENIGKRGSSDTDIINNFNINLGQRYQMVLAKLNNYMTQVPRTASTVADQQYYHYPPDIVNIEGIVITVGDRNYPITCISSQLTWDMLNAVPIQPSAIPQFFFPRRDDFGIWPIPQDAYTMTFNFHYRDRNLSVADYTTGTVTLANGDATVTGDSTVFTAAMVGRWFCVTDTTQTGQGLWYRIASFTSTTAIELENTWQSTAVTAGTYKICECPEIPDEGHVILIDGATSDFYAGSRNDITSATWFNNKFWTGDGNNNSRNEGDQNIKSGLIGLMNFYSDRNKSVIVSRQPRINLLRNSIWGYSVTS